MKVFLLEAYNRPERISSVMKIAYITGSKKAQAIADKFNARKMRVTVGQLKKLRRRRPSWM